MTQDVCMGRKAVDSRAAEALDMAFGGAGQLIAEARDDEQK
jgi:hypothetical protein